MSVTGGDWMSGWLGGSYTESVPAPTPTPPEPVPSPVSSSSPDYVDHVEEGVSRLVLQFRKQRQV